MSFKINIGKSDFETLRKTKSYYVDKTEFIYDLVNNTDNMVSLFTRPRRFGKTLMMSMMENFFSIRKNSRDLFEGLDILKHKDFCDEWMNQYPVVFLSFKEIDFQTFDVAYDKLKNAIANICKQYEDVVKNQAVNQADLKIFDRLMFQEVSVAEVQEGLKTIMRILHGVYGKKVILLIDEYDVPLAKAQKNGYYALMLDVIRGVMSSSLKDNEYLQFAVVTGCLRIAKESIFTGTNNFATYSVIDENFSTYFGFSEKEVRLMLEKAQKSDKADLIKEWYDGYLFGSSHLYCPWDVVYYLSELTTNPNTKPKNYWENTSSNDILLAFAKRTDFNVLPKFKTLLNGGTITQTISDNLTYDSLHSSEDNLWSTLVMSGYLTKKDPTQDSNTVSLRIPNKEVSSIFENTVISWFQETLDTSKQKAMMEALWSKDEAKASELITSLLKRTISYHDYHENYYHAFLAGIFVGLGYSVASNKEKGSGRPDIVLLDSYNDRAIVIEAKKSVSESDMESDCIKAGEQIVNREYKSDISLDECDTILCYGISFYKKTAKIKLVSK